MRVSQARGMDEGEYPGSYKDRDVVGGEVDEEEYRCQSSVLYVTGNVGTQHLYPRNKPYPSGAGSLREFPRGYVSEDASSRMVRAPVRPRTSLDRDDPGALVLLGMRLRFALAAGSLLMFVLTFGSALRQDWDIAGLQLIYAAVYAALLAFREKDWFSLDSLMLRRHGWDRNTAQPSGYGYS